MSTGHINTKGFAKFMSNNNVHRQMSGDAALVTESANLGDAVFSTLQAVLPFEFLLLILGVSGVAFMLPHICGCRDFWRNCFTECRWWYPPRNFWMDILNFVVNVHWVIVLTRFLWDTKAFKADTNDHVWYFGIFMIAMVYFILRYWWNILFYNYHKKSMALIMAIVFSGLMMLLTLIMMILLGVRHVWLPFGFSIPIFVWNVLLFSWSITVYQCFSGGICKPWSPKPAKGGIEEQQQQIVEQPVYANNNNSLLSSNLTQRGNRK